MQNCNVNERENKKFVSKIVMKIKGREIFEKGNSIIEIMLCLLATSLFVLIFYAHKELLNILRGGEILFAERKKAFSFSEEDTCSSREFKKGFLEKYCCNEEKLQCAVYIVSTN